MTLHKFLSVAFIASAWTVAPVVAEEFQEPQIIEEAESGLIEAAAHPEIEKNDVSIEKARKLGDTKRVTLLKQANELRREANSIRKNRPIDADRKVEAAREIEKQNRYK